MSEDNIVYITAEDIERSVTCSNCDSRWLPRKRQPYHQCSKCGHLNARSPEEIVELGYKKQGKDVANKRIAKQPEWYRDIFRSARPHLLWVIYQFEIEDKLPTLADLMDTEGCASPHHHVRELEEAGLIERYKARGTGRRKYIALTSKGYHVAENIDRIFCWDNSAVSEVVEEKRDIEEQLFKEEYEGELK